MACSGRCLPPLAEFKREIGAFIQYLRRRPRRRSSGVLYPGEIEHQREQDRRQNGIEVEDSTWDKIKSLAEATASPASSRSDPV